MKKSICAMALASASLASMNATALDFGQQIEKLLSAKSRNLFGIVAPLKNSSDQNIHREMGQKAGDLVNLAKGLKAKIITREAGNSADMLALWPNPHEPSHLIFCIEGGRADLGTTLVPGITKYNPSIQRIEIKSGAVETILRGMNRCDGIRTTAWGTVLATEETGDGSAYELIDPLTTTDHTVTDRNAGSIVDATGAASTTVAKRPALPTMAWEGLTVTSEGVVIGGDELRPGSSNLDADGGAIFKFVPNSPHGHGTISDLSESPLVNGDVFALTVSCTSRNDGNFPQYGQGCEIGEGSWVKVNAATARSDADASGATGYYRPEDLHADPIYEGDGLRFCWTNTGSESAQNYAEAICAIDENPIPAQPMLAEACVEVDEDTDGNTLWGARGDGLLYLYDGENNTICSGTSRINMDVVVANRFVEGDTDFNSFDNLAFQPSTGNLYVIEDHPNGDIFGCLKDGKDRDTKTDGCVRVLSMKDPSAEPSGFEFTADGNVAFLSVQHSNDDSMPLVDDYRTDDIVMIWGWKNRWRGNIRPRWNKHWNWQY